jgi:hypothetical protein
VSNKREAAVVLNSRNPELYSVRYGWTGWWSGPHWWTVVSAAGDKAWTYKDARMIADSCLENGVVPGDRTDQVIPIMEVDEV